MKSRTSRSALLSALASVVLAVTVSAPVPVPAAYPTALRAEHGVVAADSDVASAIGVEILEAGGNAFDAAVTTALVLGVVHPQSSGIGGGGFAISWHADERRASALDFRETAPAAAHRDMYIVDGKADSALSKWGGLSVAVPGEVAGLWELHRRHGKLPWRRVVEPAAKLAAKGFRVDRSLARALRYVKATLPADPTLAKLYFHPDGRPRREGETVHNRALAATLRILAKGGRDSFYAGPIAREMVRAVKATGGILTAKDLAEYAVRERVALHGRYRGFDVYAMPPPSSGGIALLQTLAMLETRDLRALELGSSRYFHALTEALKHAFADRASFLGDTDFAEVPVATLLSKSYTATLAARIDGWTHPHSWYGGAAAGLLPHPPGPVAPPTDAGTTHFSVIDAEGNVVALTSTINLYFGSRNVAGATGIVMNDEMDDFSVQPGVPNFFGLIQSELNSIEPGKRPLSSMCPIIVVADGEPIWSAGGAGGPMIITSTIQATLAHLDFGKDPLAAVSVPRIHHQWMPDKLLVEGDVAADVRRALKRMGHELVVGPARSALQAVSIDRDSGLRYAGSDPRKGGLPAGY